MNSLPRPVVRRARPDDAEPLAHLHLDVWDDAYTGLLPQPVLDARRRDVPARVRQWHSILTTPDSPGRTWVAERSDELVGFTSSGPARDDAPLPDLELWALYVRASAYGTGTGFALLGESIGDRAAYLWVLEGNERAIGFYLRQGFRLDGEVDEQEEGRHLRMVRTAADRPER